MKKTFSRATLVCLMLVMAVTTALAAPTVHNLPATPQTTWTGYYDNSMPPAITINSGDIVRTSTLTQYDDRFKPGMTIDEVMALRKEYNEKGANSHTLTGPIYVNGAEPGDVLEIKIIKYVPRPYAVNGNLDGSWKTGALPEDFPRGQFKDFVIDLKKMTAKFSPTIEIPVKPFMGIMAVAPATSGRVPTIPPEAFGGNMDLKELVAGTTLYLPVFVNGALFCYGDAHAAQGDGEVNLNAMETAFDEIEYQIIVRKDMSLNGPMAESDTHYITMGFDPDLNQAVKIALRNMITFLVEKKGLTELDAYSLCSIAADLRVTQVVDKNKGIHVMLPKSIFKK